MSRDDRTVPVLTETRLAISFTVTARDPGSRARAGTIATERGEVQTPAFLPVGTAATVKGDWPVPHRRLEAPPFAGARRGDPGGARLRRPDGPRRMRGIPRRAKGCGGGREKDLRVGAPQPRRVPEGGGRPVRNRPGGDGPGPPQAQCRGDLRPPVSRIRDRGVKRRGGEGTVAGDGGVHRPPPSRGEAAIPDGGRDAGGHPVRRVPGGGPVRLRAAHEERPERDALHLGGAGVDQAGAGRRRSPPPGRGVRLSHVPDLLPRLSQASLSPEGDSLPDGADGAPPALLPAMDGTDPRGNFYWKFWEFCERITRFRW